MKLTCDFVLSSSTPSTTPLLLLSNPSTTIMKRNKSQYRRSKNNYKQSLTTMNSASGDNNNNNSNNSTTKMVTFLGKGGSGKTTSAVFAAQHYALTGLKTCLLIQSQDKASEYLLGQKIGNSPIQLNDNLSAVRLETTKMFLEPFKKLKEADSRLKITQGVLEGMVGEELGILPGMDSIFSTLTLARYAGFLRDPSQKNLKDKYDVIVYDGVSTEETLRMVGASSKSRLYLKYLRNMAEKTDIGRLAGPSLIRLVDEAVGISKHSSSPLNGSTSSEIWDIMEQLLEQGSSAFKDPRKFGCFLVMDPKSKVSVNSALHYWGCTIQAGAQVSGALAISSPNLELAENVRKNFIPLPFASTPDLSEGSSVNWKAVIQDSACKDSRDILSMSALVQDSSLSPVKFDATKRTVTLLMPGFDKSEIKLYQYRGGSELLVEAGDQRRVISLPSGIQGKVGGAKFVDRSLIITMR